MIRLENRVSGDDAVLGAAPGIAEGKGRSHSIIPGIEGRQLLRIRQLPRYGRRGYQTPATDNGFPLGYSLVARIMLWRPAHEHALVARPHVVLADGRRLLAHAELLEQQLDVLQRLVVAAHGILQRLPQYRDHLCWGCRSAPI